MTQTISRASLPLVCVVLLFPAISWGQQDLRSGKKGTTDGSPVTSTVVDANRQALDVNIATYGPGENATARALTQIYTSDSGTPVRYTTTGDKNVKSTVGELVGIMASSGTSVTVAVYDDADGTCNSTQVTGTISLTNGAFLKLPYRFSTGICITVGGTSPDLTVVYK